MGASGGGAEAPPGPSKKIGKYVARKVLKFAISQGVILCFTQAIDVAKKIQSCVPAFSRLMKLWSIQNQVQVVAFSNAPQMR